MKVRLQIEMELHNRSPSMAPSAKNIEGTILRILMDYYNNPTTEQGRDHVVSSIKVYPTERKKYGVLWKKLG
jgi:hypothetical protein